MAPSPRTSLLCLARVAACTSALACTAPNPAFERSDAAPADGPILPPLAGFAGGPPRGGAAAGAAGEGGAGGSPAGAGGSAEGAVHFDFETGVESWSELRGNALTLQRSTVRAASGSASLELVLDVAGAADRYAGMSYIPRLTLPAGTVVHARVWVPSNAPILGVQPFVLYFADTTGDAMWQGRWRSYGELLKDGWTDVSVTAPSNVGVVELGVQVETTAAWQGSIFVDRVSW